MNIEDSSAFPEDIIHSPKSHVAIQDIICSTLNLQQYINRYERYTRLRRLQFIMENCSNLRHEAYFMYLDECKRTCNVEAYISHVSRAVAILGPDATVDLDHSWIETTERKVSTKLQRLTNESTAARSSMINESIRLSYNDLGYHYYEIGNLLEAQRLFLRMRDYCNTYRHHADMAFSVISVIIDMGLFQTLPGYLSKASNSTDVLSVAKTKAVSGICQLNDKNYADASRHFFQVDKEIESHFSSVIVPEDIALYAVLCGLATLERKEFKALVESKSFKPFLDLVPDIKSLVSNFLRRDFKECLPYLMNMKNEWKLDIYLARHVDSLLEKIKERIIIDYLAPYNTLTLSRMASSLSMNLEEVEKQLFDLIVQNKIDALIDDESKTIKRKEKNSHDILVNSIQDASRNNVVSLQNGLLRLSIIKNKLSLVTSEGNEGIGRLDSHTKNSIETLVNLHPRSSEAGEPRVVTHDDMVESDDAEDRDD